MAGHFGKNNEFKHLNDDQLEKIRVHTQNGDVIVDKDAYPENFFTKTLDVLDAATFGPRHVQIHPTPIAIKAHYHHKR